jgi:UPF0716 protein FxsA
MGSGFEGPCRGPAHRRPRGRRVGWPGPGRDYAVAMPLLVLLFIVVPLAELFVIIEVGQAIGVPATIGLLFLDSVLGAVLLRSQGRAVWRRFNLALAEGRVPARETFDGAMVIFGGALLLTPGFITDVFGLLLLIPPTRAAIRRLSSRMVKRRVAAGRAVFWTYDRYRAGRGAGAPSPGGTPPRPYDVEGTAHEVPPERDALPGERSGER